MFKLKINSIQKRHLLVKLKLAVAVDNNKYQYWPNVSINAKMETLK